MQIVTPGPTRKNVYKEVARLRNQDAKVLFSKGRLLGAVYLLCYSIECHLKFAACDRNGWDKLPQEVRMPGCQRSIRLYTHEWPVLVEVTGIKRDIEQQDGINAIYSALCERLESELRDLRYRTKFTGNEGCDLYKDLPQLYQFLKETIP